MSKFGDDADMILEMLHNGEKVAEEMFKKVVLGAA